VDGGPTRRGVPAAQEFLVDAFMAGTAVSRREMRANDKAVVILLLLVRAGAWQSKQFTPFFA